jgi:hypothetical protein
VGWSFRRMSCRGSLLLASAALETLAIQ